MNISKRNNPVSSQNTLEIGGAHPLYNWGSENVTITCNSEIFIAVLHFFAVVVTREAPCIGYHLSHTLVFQLSIGLAVELYATAFLDTLLFPSLWVHYQKLVILG